MIMRVLKTFVPITVRPRIRPQDSREFCVLILSFTVQVSIQVYKGTARVNYSIQGSVLFRCKPVSELSPFRAPELQELLQGQTEGNLHFKVDRNCPKETRKPIGIRAKHFYFFYTYYFDNYTTRKKTPYHSGPLIQLIFYGTHKRLVLALYCTISDSPMY